MSQQPSSADVLGPKEVLDAQELGRAAAVSGERAGTCPWKTPGSDKEHALRQMWIRGYAQGRTELRQAGEAPEQPRQSPS